MGRESKPENPDAAESQRTRQLARIRAAMAECDREHSEDELIAARQHLESWRTSTKQSVMSAYHKRRLPAVVVRLIFRVLKLRAA